MKYITDLIEKIEGKGHELFWYGSASSDEILELEKLVGVNLSTSFKSFLSQFGGGGVVESEISGIEENTASSDNGRSVYGDTLTCREDYSLPKYLVVIFFKDDEICWCLDSTDVNSEGEYAVVSYSLFERRIDNRIATSFSQFFMDYLELRAA
ncbi:SMI1/KNR4 family protein [Pseudoalteromonas sp. SMS1]|uniref:SMI1/KNR4 family protein n=1 Tax=Pseudoalteromonas sp. SMS1 TaxID=2908894 RepID=UPI001F3948B5|nr:SMI1/KNR4 family protein [Pseudoalteromonas sp. SMS1]MCF2858753.1 SMI1/KNR4 family protein [Pseudoalteromonas sp. SMS1]